VVDRRRGRRWRAVRGEARGAPEGGGDTTSDGDGGYEEEAGQDGGHVVRGCSDRLFPPSRRLPDGGRRQKRDFAGRHLNP
jgi:hypothetical protein